MHWVLGGTDGMRYYNLYCGGGGSGNGKEVGPDAAIGGAPSTDAYLWTTSYG